MSADDHDRAVAATSHVPHLVAAVLAGSLPAEALPLASTGFADTTRVAAGDPALWRQILLDNAPHVLNTLAGFATLLDSARAAIEAGDARKLEQILTEAKQRRDALGS
jgi:prephenate dehydrogenase